MASFWQKPPHLCHDILIWFCIVLSGFQQKTIFDSKMHFCKGGVLGCLGRPTKAAKSDNEEI